MISSMTAKNTINILDSTIQRGGSLFEFQHAGSSYIVSQNNNFTYCLPAKYGGIFKLNSLVTFTDQQSSYSNIYGDYGGAIYCNGCNMTL